MSFKLEKVEHGLIYPLHRLFQNYTYLWYGCRRYYKLFKNQLANCHTRPHMGSFFVILGVSKIYLMQLRPHQEKAIKAMSKHNKGQVIVPTGGGKTICMIQDAIEQFKSNRLKTNCGSCTSYSIGESVM